MAAYRPQKQPLLLLAVLLLGGLSVAFSLAQDSPSQNMQVAGQHTVSAQVQPTSLRRLLLINAANEGGTAGGLVAAPQKADTEAGDDYEVAKDAAEQGTLEGGPTPDAAQAAADADDNAEARPSSDAAASLALSLEAGPVASTDLTASQQEASTTSTQSTGDAVAPSTGGEEQRGSLQATSLGDVASVPDADGEAPAAQQDEPTDGGATQGGADAADGDDRAGEDGEDDYNEPAADDADYDNDKYSKDKETGEGAAAGDLKPADVAAPGALEPVAVASTDAQDVAGAAGAADTVATTAVLTETGTPPAIPASTDTNGSLATLDTTAVAQNATEGMVPQQDAVAAAGSSTPAAETASLGSGLLGNATGADAVPDVEKPATQADAAMALGVTTGTQGADGSSSPNGVAADGSTPAVNATGSAPAPTTDAASTNATALTADGAATAANSTAVTAADATASTSTSNPITTAEDATVITGSSATATADEAASAPKGVIVVDGPDGLGPEDGSEPVKASDTTTTATADASNSTTAAATLPPTHAQSTGALETVAADTLGDDKPAGALDLSATGGGIDAVVGSATTTSADNSTAPLDALATGAVPVNVTNADEAALGASHANTTNVNSSVVGDATIPDASASTLGDDGPAATVPGTAEALTDASTLVTPADGIATSNTSTIADDGTIAAPADNSTNFIAADGTAVVMPAADASLPGSSAATDGSTIETTGTNRTAAAAVDDSAAAGNSTASTLGSSTAAAATVEGMVASADATTATTQGTTSISAGTLDATTDGTPANVTVTDLLTDTVGANATTSTTATTADDLSPTAEPTLTDGAKDTDSPHLVDVDPLATPATTTTSGEAKTTFPDGLSDKPLGGPDDGLTLADDLGTGLGDGSLGERPAAGPASIPEITTPLAASPADDPLLGTNPQSADDTVAAAETDPAAAGNNPWSAAQAADNQGYDELSDPDDPDGGSSAFQVDPAALAAAEGGAELEDPSDTSAGRAGAGISLVPGAGDGLGGGGGFRGKRKKRPGNAGGHLGGRPLQTGDAGADVTGDANNKITMAHTAPTHEAHMAATADTTGTVQLPAAGIEPEKPSSNFTSMDMEAGSSRAGMKAVGSLLHVLTTPAAIGAMVGASVLVTLSMAGVLMGRRMVDSYRQKRQAPASSMSLYANQAPTGGLSSGPGGGAGQGRRTSEGGWSNNWDNSSDGWEDVEGGLARRHTNGPGASGGGVGGGPGGGALQQPKQAKHHLDDW